MTGRRKMLKHTHTWGCDTPPDNGPWERRNVQKTPMMQQSPPLG